MKKLHFLTILVLSSCRPDYVMEESNDGHYRIYSTVTHNTLEVLDSKQKACDSLKYWNRPLPKTTPFEKENQFAKQRKWSPTNEDCP